MDRYTKQTPQGLDNDKETKSSVFQEFKNANSKSRDKQQIKIGLKKPLLTINDPEESSESSNFEENGRKKSFAYESSSNSDENDNIHDQAIKLMYKNKSLDRMPILFDDETVVTESNLNQSGKMTAAENKEMYMRNFGINFQMPTLYILDSIVSQKNPDLIVQLTKQVFPDNIEVQTHYQGANQLIQESQKDPILSLNIIKDGRMKPFKLDSIDAKIKFSRDGETFCVFRDDLFEFYNTEAIVSQLLQDAPQYKYQHDEDTGYIEEFDFTKDCLVAWGGLKVLKIDLGKGSPTVYKLKENLFSKIYSAYFTILDEEEHCFLVCHRTNMNCLSIFNMLEKDESIQSAFEKAFKLNFQGQRASKIMRQEAIKHVNFQKQITEKLIVRVNDDKFLFADVDEKFILKFVSKTSVVKKELKCLKPIRHVETDSRGGFRFITYDDYDTAMYIHHSETDDKVIQVKRNIEPNVLRIFDIKDKKVLSLYDEQFCVDKLDEQNQEFVCYQMQSAFSINWPFVTWSGFDRDIYLANAFDRKELQRIKIVDEQDDSNVEVIQTFISDTYDIFFTVCRDQTQYQIFMIDLDNFKNIQLNADQHSYKIEGPLVEYTTNDVDNQRLVQMHARGSSRKESPDLDQSLILFLLHEDSIYSYSQHSETKKLEFVSKTKSINLYRLSDQSFFFRKNDSEIMQISILSSTYDLKTVFKEMESNITSFNVDQIHDRLIILSRTENVIQGVMREEYRFRMFCLMKQHILYEQVIQFPQLIGKLKQSQYTFADGHIYYNNNVIKIRYDLIEKSNNQIYQENEIFDYYFDIFQLQQDKYVRTCTPLDSIRKHKLAYVISDKSFKEPQRLLMLPYLHDRRIYLSSIKQNKNYFFTSMETAIKDETEYHDKLFHALSGTYAKRKSIQFDAQKMKDSYNVYQKDKKFDSIICMNATDRKIYVYQLNGLQINRVDFTEFSKKHGDPICTSTNGLNFVFRKTFESKDIGLTFNKSKNIQNMKISIVQLNIFGINHIKDIDILKIFQEECLKNGEDLPVDLFSEDMTALFVINDQLDVCVKLVLKDDQSSKDRCFYLFIEGESEIHNKLNRFIRRSFDQTTQFKQNIAESANGTNKQDYKRLLVTKRDQYSNIQMNDNILFMWTNTEIDYYYHSQGFSSNKKQIEFQIELDPESERVCEIRTGRSPHKIIIIIESTIDLSKTVIQWDLLKNVEMMAINFGKADFEILWDHKGDAYIAINGTIIFVEKKTTHTLYDFQDLTTLRTQSNDNNNQFSEIKGIRFDGKNHNWLIFKEFLALGFSYMTFVILDKIEQGDELQKGNVFDLEPYNYIFNKSNPFIDGDFVFKDHQRLEYVLNNLRQLNPTLLNHLTYNQNIYKRADKREQVGKNSALHIAVNQGNNRSVDIILKYMSMIKFCNSSNFSQLFPKLIEYPNFLPYLQELPFQTKTMEKKQILRVKDPLNDQIVKICDSCQMIIDEKFFEINMSESNSQEIKNYPVKVVALRVGWIISQKEGYDFLNEMAHSENLDIYKVKTIQMIIEYMYLKVKTALIKIMFPLFIVKAIILELVIFKNEQLIKKLITKENELVQDILDPSEIIISWKVQILLLTGICLFQGVYLTIMTKFIGYNILKQIQFWTKSLFIVSFSIQAYLIFYVNEFQGTPNELKQTFKDMRNLELFSKASLYIESIYYLRLIDKIAPLIDIMSKIFIDMRFFMVILGISIYVFANAYFLIGQNQIDFDDVEEEDVPYRTLMQSISYIYHIILGDFDTSAFSKGGGSQEICLQFLFVLTTFVFIINLLNMLIAIMGQTFSARSGVETEIKLKDHLLFVVDNFHFIDYAIHNGRDKINYIVAAFSSKNDLVNEQNEFDRKEDILKIYDKIRDMEVSINRITNNLCKQKV